MKRILNKISKPIKKLSQRWTKVKPKSIELPTAMAEQIDLDKKLVFSLAKKRFPNWKQFQYLSKYLSKKEKIIIRVLLALVIISLGLLLIRFYQRHVVYLPQDGGNYIEALVGQPSYINPASSQN